MTIPLQYAKWRIGPKRTYTGELSVGSPSAKGIELHWPGPSCRMKQMSDDRKKTNRGQWVAWLILVVSLTVTFFGWWRERELARRGQIIRWQETFAQINPILSQLLGQRFDNLRDYAKATFLRNGLSDSSWADFLKISEWRQRYPGMLEIGYADFLGERCLVRFIASESSAPAHPIGFDMNSQPEIRQAVQKAADAGYPVASQELESGEGPNKKRVVLGFIPMRAQDKRPASPGENRENLRGFVFFALNHADYFRSCQYTLNALPVRLRLLAMSEPSPPRTPTRRAFTQSGLSGEWRFVATMKHTTASAALPQWIALGGGTALSFLLFFLFSIQTRLRHEAELARESVLARDVQITALNRDLEEKVTARTLELNKALAEEKELNQLKSNFISMVSHEIRTPLALILSSAEILSRYLDRLAPDKRQRHLDHISESVHRMTALMEDVLLFSRAEAGRMEFRPAPLDLATLCRQLAEEIASTTAQRCPIETKIELSMEPARGDEALIRHILINLLSNAVKYSAPGMPVKFQVTHEVGDAVFRVEDRGIGIPEVDRTRLFTPFHRGANATYTTGTGLGLVIVRRCVERHGGFFEIDAENDNGVTAIVRLPMFSPAHTEFVKRFD